MNSLDNTTSQEFEVLKKEEEDPLLRPESPVIIETEDVPKHYQIIAYQRRPTTLEKMKMWLRQVGYDVYFRLRWIYLYGL